MDHSEKIYRATLEYIQAVLGVAKFYDKRELTWHVEAGLQGASYTYWVLDPDGKALEPFVLKGAVAGLGARAISSAGTVALLYKRLLELHARKSDEDPQHEFTYVGSLRPVKPRPAAPAIANPTRPNPAPVTHRRPVCPKLEEEEKEKPEDDYGLW
ncbi:hypothetical protein [Arthrobacter sp. A2-55]|uniref:hypothetical protein n=1 Tax=Arthrobacter sp. A2-55 TaxID=2897337 RepID=UPI0021CDD051|nr:hypothetical protein [Arthrobacter sp. A2-55]MCU6480542.1 hypothetical protein [Arthrobacter sp. A2-55]